METESILKKYQETSELINGYSQPFAIERALGFDSEYELQSSIQDGHLINAGDIKHVMYWLFKNGFDVIKLPKSTWFIENHNGSWLEKGKTTLTLDPLKASQFDTEAEATMYAKSCGIHNVKFTEHEFIG